MIQNPLLSALIVLAVIFGAASKKIRDSEMRSAAAREQTIFLAFIYIFVKSGKTLVEALLESSKRRDLMRHLAGEAAKLRRMTELKTLPVALNNYRHPNPEFALLIRSIGEDVEGGFGLDTKLERMLETIIVREGERWSRYVNTVETLGEATVAIILLTPLFYLLGAIFGGFNTLIIVLVAAVASVAMYVVSAASTPTALVEIPQYIVAISTALIILSSAALFTTFFMPTLYIYAPLVTGAVLLGWGLFAHFRYVRRAVGEGEGAYLMLDTLASRMKAGYPIGKSLEAMRDERYNEYAKRMAHGLEAKPLNKLMRIAIETIKVARHGGLGAEALGLLSRLALRVHLAFTEARARMKLYDGLSIISGAIIIAISAFTLMPFTQIPPEVATEVQRIIAQPSLDPIYPPALLTSLFLGSAISRTSDQTIAGTWRAGAGVLTTLASYLIASTVVPA